jgi:MFS family permease
MVSILAHRTYRHLFLAQVVALTGTGLLTVALGLLAFELAGAQAGAVLGTALAIKMIAYVTIAPVAAAFTQRLPRRAVLITLDLVRAGIALALPFVTEIWQVYLCIFVLQAASAGFTPTFQAVIPDILPDEREYTRALSLSRLTYDLESLVSPMLAAGLLAVMSYHDLFVGTVLGFVGSALLVFSVALPPPKGARTGGIYDRTTRGLRLYLATPRLRGLLALNLAVAAGGSLVFVNTVVYVQGVFGLDDRATALALAAFGGGSMIVALALPRLLDQWPDRPVMLAGASFVTLATLCASFVTSFAALWAVWLVMGAGYSLALTPSGRLLRRSGRQADRPALFAAQFSLSHACWLITYPLAGWAGARLGLSAAAMLLTVIAILGVGLALWMWPASDEAVAPN